MAWVTKRSGHWTFNCHCFLGNTCGLLRSAIHRLIPSNNILGEFGCACNLLCLELYSTTR
eukprot:2735497-Amphidinium_carterae.1